MKNEMVFEATPRLPIDGSGIISVRDLGPVENNEMEAVWEDDDGGRIVVRGAGLPVLKWAFYQPAAETRWYQTLHDWHHLDQDLYDALAMGPDREPDDEPDREP